MYESLSNTVLMVRPNHFGYNPETAGSNPFMNHAEGSESYTQMKALEEFNSSVTVLRDAGVRVLVLESREDVITPDSVFPNNWFSHHRDGRLVLYPMYAENRRLERQPEKLSQLLKENDVQISEMIDDAEIEESHECVLEGTGSISLDRMGRVAYAVNSVRTSHGAFERWCEKMSYEGVFFDAYDPEGIPIYHTNIILNVGETFAVICLESISDADERAMVVNMLESHDKEIIDISFDQVYRFCGNILQIKSEAGEPIITLSATAYEAFHESQIEALERHGKLVIITIPTIETIGGGSARCMLSEVF
jgi:hypothetical protein